VHDEMREPTEEELRAAMEEQMRRIRVEDVVLQSLATLVNLAGRRLGVPGTEDERDLEQAKLAIDAARALVPTCPPDQQEPIRQALSQVQMAYARAAQEPTGDSRQSTGAQYESPGSSPQSPGQQDEGAGEESAQDAAERAKARAKIWTPPGA
jgi:hypothetical protein